jgi:predicted RNase H-like HicB family nuclease
MLAFGETLDEARANACEEIEAWIDEENRTRDLAAIDRRHR